MSENKKFMKNSLVIMISEMALKLKGFIFLPLITKTFGALNYGIWAQVGIIQGIISPLAVMGLDSASTRFVPGKSKEDAAKSFTTVYLYLIISSCFFGTALIIFAPAIARYFFGGRHNSRFVVLCAPAIFVGILLAMLKCYYRILDAAKAFSLIRIVESLLPIVPLIIVLVLNLSLYVLIWAEILCSLIITLFFVSYLLKLIGLEHPDFGLIPKFLKFGAAVMPAGYAMWILNASDRLFIARFCDFKELGVYASVYSLGYMFINVFFNPFWIMYPARAAELYNENKIEQLKRLYKKSTKAVLFFLVPAMFGLSLLGKPFMRVFTTEEFVHGGNLMFYVTLGYIFHMLASYFSVNLGLVNKPFFSTITLYTCAFTNLFLNYVLIRSNGILGAAIATCISFALQFLLEFYFSYRFSKIQLRLDWVSLGKSLVSSAVMMIVLLSISASGVSMLVDLILVVMIGVFIYFISQFIFKFFDFNEAMAVLDILGIKRYSSCLPIKYALLYLK
ncbi:oligosaccharide flippase family protein [bacterium]|nr:oligosaccharide flippase family protein [bacterium]